MCYFQLRVEFIEGPPQARVAPGERGTDAVAVTLSILTLAVIGAVVGVVIGWWRKKGSYDWRTRYPVDTPLCEDEDNMDSVSVCRFDQPEPSVQLS